MDLIRRKITRALRRIQAVGREPRSVMTVGRDAWEKEAQSGEFAFHRKDRWRPSDDFLRQSEALFRHFGFALDGFAGSTVMDLGAGSKLRTKVFTHARL